MPLTPLKLVLVVAAALALQGCVVGTVAGAGAKAAGTAVDVTADAAGAGAHAVFGHHK